jgi:hypothetical protein
VDLVEVVSTAWTYVLSREVLCAAVLVPSILIALATAARWLLGLPFTSWADTLMAVAAFDSAAILDNNLVRGFLTNPLFSSHIAMVHYLLGAAAGIAWLVVIGVSERPLRSFPDVKRHSAAAMARSGVGCLFAGSLVALHILTYMAGSAKA